MTLKLTIMSAVLGAGLIGAAGQARADSFHVNVAPARVGYVQTTPPPRGSVWHRRYYRPAYRPAVVVRAPSYGYASGHEYTAAANPQDPSVVAAQIRADVDRASEDVRFDVRQGVVEQRALASLEADRQEIERDLSEASAKGYITVEDRTHLEQHVQEIRDLRTELRCAPERQASYWR